MTRCGRSPRPDYGWCDASLIEMIRAASGIEDPNLIFAGQVLVLPALPAPPPPPAPIVAAEDATWAVHTVVYGDTFWDILTARYGSEPSTDLMWAAAEYNQLEDPSDIPVGMQLTLPPLAVLLGEQAAPAPPVVPVPEAVPVAVEAAPPVAEDGAAGAAGPQSKRPGHRWRPKSRLPIPGVADDRAGRPSA